MAKSSRDAYSADGEKKVLLIAPEKLKLVTDKKHPLYDPRVELEVDEGLVLDVMEHGILQPVTIRKNTESGEIEIVFGRQRVKAALEANRRLRKARAETISVPCMPRAGDDATLFGVSISENEHRQADTPMGRAEKARRLLDLGKSEEQVARRFGVSPATLKNMLSLLEATAAVRNAVESGKILASIGYQLAKLEPDEQRARLEKVLKEAPRVAGKKRSASGGKAREIASGKKRKKRVAEISGVEASWAEVSGAETGVYTRPELAIEEKRQQIAEHLKIPGEVKRLMELVFEWLAGRDEAFAEFDA